MLQGEYPLPRATLDVIADHIDVRPEGPPRPRGWNPLPRRRCDPSDTWNEEWALIEPLLPVPPATPQPATGRRSTLAGEIVDAIRYVVDTGCNWRVPCPGTSRPGTPATGSWPAGPPTSSPGRSVTGSASGSAAIWAAPGRGRHRDRLPVGQGRRRRRPRLPRLRRREENQRSRHLRTGLHRSLRPLVHHRRVAAGTDTESGHRPGASIRDQTESAIWCRGPLLAHWGRGRRREA